MSTALKVGLLLMLLAGCAHRPVSDKPWTTKNLVEAIEDAQHAQEDYR